MMLIREQANGIAYTEDGVTIVFPHGTGPYLVWHHETVRIDQPERFGAYHTKRQRTAYVRNYIAELEEERHEDDG